MSSWLNSINRSSLLVRDKAARKGARRGAVRGASRPQPRRNYRPLLVRAVASLAAVSVLLGLVSWLAQSQQDSFVIRSIEITGNREFLSNDQVRDALQSHSEGDFFKLDIDSTREALLALPWVQEVSLRREWPDKLVVVLKEQQAVARWNTLAGDKGLLNESAEVFAGLSEAAELKLPQLVGPERKSERVLREYAELSTQLKPLGHEITMLKLDARNTWEMQLANGVAIRFLERNKASAIERLVVALKVFEHDDIAQVARIDLRYSNGFAVSWKEEGSDV